MHHLLHHHSHHHSHHHRHLYTSLIMPIITTSQLLTSSSSSSSSLPRLHYSLLPTFPFTGRGRRAFSCFVSMRRPPAPRPRPKGAPPVPAPVPASQLVLSRNVHLHSLESQSTDATRVALKDRLLKYGIDCGDCTPGQYNHMICPRCEGGSSKERSMSLLIREDCDLAVWTCHRAKCGWDGSVRATVDVRGYRGKNLHKKEKSYKLITEKDICLEPLCEELMTYLDERMISGETLRRNGVMQRIYADNQLVIAFAYRRDGELVSCNYQDVMNNFWQEEDTEKIFYGLDDIKGASDIIIVGGEIDKLSMEEAGFRNCVSVPDGASLKVSLKEIPAEEEV